MARRSPSWRVHERKEPAGPARPGLGYEQPGQVQLQGEPYGARFKPGSGLVGGSVQSPQLGANSTGGHGRRPRSPTSAYATDPDWGSLTLCRWILFLFACLVSAMGGAGKSRGGALVKGAGVRRSARDLAPLRFLAAARHRRARLAAAAALVALATALSTASFLANDFSHKAIKNAESFLALIAERSPGSRTGDELTKTKAAAPGPEAASGAPTPPQLGPAVKPPLSSPGIALQAVPLANLPSMELFSPPLLAADPFPPPFDASSPPPGCCGTPGEGAWPGPGPGVPGVPGPPGPPDAGGFPPGSPGTPGPPPVAPVPEPASWAMMLIGFCLIGWSVRKRGIDRTREASAH